MAACNFSLTFLFVIIATLTKTGVGVKIFERCTANDQCTSFNSFCQIISPTCGSGTCMCLDSFESDEHRIWCKRSVPFGGICRAKYEACVTPNADCIDGTCKCKENFSEAPYGGECILTLAMVLRGQPCLLSEQCLNEHICDNATQVCVCPPGYRESTEHKCVKNEVGDSCASDADCSALPDTNCQGGKCACFEPGMKKQVSILDSAEYANIPKFRMGYRCFASGSPGGEAGECQPYSQLGEIKYCAWPYHCRFCNYGFMCVLPHIIFSDEAPQLRSHFLPVTFLMALAVAYNAA